MITSDVYSPEQSARLGKRWSFQQRQHLARKERQKEQRRSIQRAHQSRRRDIPYTLEVFSSFWNKGRASIVYSMPENAVQITATMSRILESKRSSSATLTVWLLKVSMSGKRESWCAPRPFASSKTAIATRVIKVFCFPHMLGGIFLPFSAAIERRLVTRNSRVMITKTIHAGTSPICTRATRMTETKTLSAVRSKNAPNEETSLRRRAR